MLLKFLAAALVLSVIRADSSADLVNTKVERTVDLTSHLAYVSDRITVENTGKGGQSAYNYVVEPEKARRVSSLSARLVGDKSKKADELERRRLKVTKVAQQSPK